jgi:hypothetical protein
MSCQKSKAEVFDRMNAVLLDIDDANLANAAHEKHLRSMKPASYNQFVVQPYVLYGHFLHVAGS